MKTEEEKDERMNKAGMEVIGLLGGRDFTNGEGIVILARCLASLIASNPDRRKRNETFAAALMLLTESVARMEKALDAGVTGVPEEGGGE